MPSTRLSGHGLRAEGKPCARANRHGGYERLPGPVGKALCECGATSRVLPSDGARKRWHAEHKDSLRAPDALTQAEHAAIASLQRLAKRWPRSLTLVSMDGSLHVIRTGDERYGLSFGPDRQEAIVADVDGIPNDGGAW